MPVDKMVLAVYDTHQDVEGAVSALQHSGCEAGSLSIAGKDQCSDDHVTAIYNFGGRMMHKGKYRDFWAARWERLSGGAFIDMPGIGPVLIAGPLASWVFDALEGAVMLGGLSAVGAGLYSVGLAEASILDYEAALKDDRLLLLADGDPSELRMVRATLERTSPFALSVHDSYNPGPAVATVMAGAAS